MTNWSVPTKRLSVGTNADVTGPRAFVAVTPCRVVDTRNATGPYGAPKLVGGAARTFNIPAGPCTGLPARAASFSLNFTVLNGEGASGFLTAYPTGSTRPTVSTLNYGIGNLVANAAIVPANAAGTSIDVYVNFNVDVIIDINGYFSDILGNPSNYFLLTTNSGGYTMYLQNLSTTCGGACGIYQSVASGVSGWFQNYSSTDTGAKGLIGQTSSTAANTAGVQGLSDGATGATFGVQGFNASTTSGAQGVYGSIGGSNLSNTTLNTTSGVLGASSASGTGVRVGVTGIGYDRGVTGYFCNPTCGTGGIVGVSATVGLQSFGDIVAGGAKDFIEPHPFNASKQIVYTALEGGEAGTYFRGRGRFVNGQAVISVPEDFRLVTEEEGLTVQITPLGRMAEVGVISANLNAIVAEGSRDVEFSYLVQGFRRGYTDRQPIQENSFFMPSSPSAQMEPWPERTRQMLIKLGIYHEDGTVNMQTAERLGWTKIWQQQAEEAAMRAHK